MPVSTYKSGPPVARLRLQHMNGHAYAFTFGYVLVRLHVSNVTIYGHKQEAIADAHLCGLSVDDEGELSIRPRITADVAAAAVARMSERTRQDTLAIVAALNVGAESGRTVFESLRSEREWRPSLAATVADCAEALANRPLNFGGVV